MTLKQIEQNSKEDARRLEEKLNEIPNNQSCIHSGFPKRMWCKEAKIFPIYGLCEKYPKYESRYIN